MDSGATSDTESGEEHGEEREDDSLAENEGSGEEEEEEESGCDSESESEPIVMSSQQVKKQREKSDKAKREQMADTTKAPKKSRVF